jgi:GDP-L-fucose synthase
MKKGSRIFVAGHKGLVGSAIVRQLKSAGHTNIWTVDRTEVDLTNQKEVNKWFKAYEPKYVINAAAKVGGIIGNQNHKAEMIYQNLMIESNLIEAAYRNRCKKYLFLGSSCIYPKEPQLPITEDQLMTGKLEPTNDAYAVAKIAGIYLCKSYRQQYGFNAISAMPCNLYGLGDNYHPENSHVIPGLIRKFHEAKESNQPTVTCWGDGTPLREFLYADDLANACVFLMNNFDGEEPINIGSGVEINIKTLAKTIADVIGYEGEVEWDTSKPNGTMRKVMDVSKIKGLGWSPQVSFETGIKVAYGDFLKRFG